MAWYAELKRRRWYCINRADMVAWYREAFYREWYDSLTEEQREAVEERKRAKEEESKRKARKALEELLMLGSIADAISMRTGHSFESKSSIEARENIRKIKDSLE